MSFKMDMGIMVATRHFRLVQSVHAAGDDCQRYYGRSVAFARLSRATALQVRREVQTLQSCLEQDNLPLK